MKRIIALLVGSVCFVSFGWPAGAAAFKGQLGLQLYSLRADFAKDVPASLKATREFGFRYVELAGTYNLAPEKFKALLAAENLVPIAGHFPFERYAAEPEKVAAEAKALGLKYAGCAWIPHQGAFDEKTCRHAIAVFNQAGAALAKHGLKFFYHQHGYEFGAHGQGTLMDLMMAETDPKLVAFEMDIFWVQFPGQDPAKWLEKYGKRWELVHLKDMKKGLKTGDLSGHTDVANDVALGTGQMDMPGILRAAQKAGVKWYFIEDESPSVHEQLPVSLKYLKEVKL
ncbi:MAG: sugar phosphate isomerase/epimerase [Verrucomicrobia bacterium]|nr:sugar phosphate isomerase/epimerase [Verrucomicrobiota bacterium]